MLIERASVNDANDVAAVLQEAALWLADTGRPLWTSSEVGFERTFRDTEAGRFFVARDGGTIAGVMRFELEDPSFWPEIEAGTSTFVHKLAVRRAWAKKGISTGLLQFAQRRTRELERQYLRLDCAADRAKLRSVYERFGFALHSLVQKGSWSFARYELATLPTESPQS
ncbi:GNAT family N-acetyltransferase [Cupriavidus malaysiensis]|uniref:GNAT family N-acetyltransferase n=1 Tax=Cupriavidus malaysiensis TaxID=367825 RepID=UPI000A037ED8|nr:GNAT family N-acetyltransferase [Cupriavidus malaysiensis]